VASALPQGTFSSWERGVFRDAIAQYQEIAEKIINSDVSEKPLKLTTPSVAAITDVMGYPESRIRVGEDEIS
jgi:hypothetical protein